MELSPETAAILQGVANIFSLQDDVANGEQSSHQRAAGVANRVTEAMGDPNAIGFAAGMQKKSYEKCANPFPSNTDTVAGV